MKALTCFSIASTIVFTSAEVYSEYTSGKQCLTSTDNFTQITPYFTVTRSASIGDAQFSSDAAFSFATYISQPACNANLLGGTVLVPVQTIAATPTKDPTYYPGTVLSLTSQTTSVSSAIATAAAPQNTSSQAPLTMTSRPKATLSAGAKIGIAFGALGVTLILISLAIFRYLRRRKSNKEADDRPNPPENDQPYFQQKGELEAKDVVKFELHAESRQTELDGEREIHEMPSLEASHDEQASHRQELRGEEHCKELG